MKRPFLPLALLVLLTALPLFAEPVAQEAIAGTWSGSLDIGGTKLPLVFHLALQGGSLAATMDSPSQGVTGIAASTVAFAEGKVVIAFKAMRAIFTGELSKDGLSISGTWSQGGMNLPLGLARGAEAAGFSRPQTPQPPYPYRSEEVRIPGGAAGVTLAGSLLIPEGPGPFPAVVLVTGSGAQGQGRDHTRPQALPRHRRRPRPQGHSGPAL